MPARQYPFIDIAVHARVREHFARGDAAILFSRDFERILWANDQGAAFFGAVNHGEITRIVLDEDRTGIVRRAVVYEHPSSTLSFEVGPGGRIYFSDFGAIYRLVRR